MRKILVLLIGLFIMSYASEAHASTLIINNIEVKNFLPANITDSSIDVFEVTSADTFSIDYAPDIHKFQIAVLQQPYVENRALAEQAFVEKLGVTKSEACYLHVAIVAPAFVTDQPDDNKLKLCGQPSQADINSDGVVNTFDYATCLDEIATQSPTDDKLYCDLNVNRRVDASDLSIVITHIKKK